MVKKGAMVEFKLIGICLMVKIYYSECIVNVTVEITSKKCYDK